jgi:hypothetical protein
MRYLKSLPLPHTEPYRVYAPRSVRRNAPILNGPQAQDFNRRKSAELGWKVASGGAYNGPSDARLARDLYCFIHDLNMLRKSAGAGSPDYALVQYCEGACNPDVMQGSRSNNCYNRDGMLGERTMTEIFNVLTLRREGKAVTFPSGKDWASHWTANIDLSGTKFRSASEVVIVPAASDNAKFVEDNGQQQAAYDACREQGGVNCGSAPVPSPPKPVPPTKKTAILPYMPKFDGDKRPSSTTPKKSNAGTIFAVTAAAVGAALLLG